MTRQGLHVILEGPDGSGKTTTAARLAIILAEHGLKCLVTKHPGATHLGSKIRAITKDKDIPAPPLGLQMLLAVDYLTFRNEVLRPALERQEVVISDRCNLISGFVYGLADGLTIEQLNMISRLVTDDSKKVADRIYVFRCSELEQRWRLEERHSQQDRFDSRANGFHARVTQLYNSLTTGTPEQLMILNRIVALDNIRSISGELPLGKAAELIANDILKMLAI